MNLDQEHVDMLFRKPPFKSEKIVEENKVNAVLYQSVNMLQQVKNKMSDKKLHAHPKDVEALLSEIKTSIAPDIATVSKKTTKELIDKICNKFGIEKHNMHGIVNHIKDEAAKINYNVEPFLKKSDEYIEIIKSNSV